MIYFVIGAGHVLAFVLMCYLLAAGTLGRQLWPYVAMALGAVTLPIIATAGEHFSSYFAFVFVPSNL